MVPYSVTQQPNVVLQIRFETVNGSGYGTGMQKWSPPPPPQQKFHVWEEQDDLFGGLKTSHGAWKSLVEASEEIPEETTSFFLFNSKFFVPKYFIFGY